MQPRYPAAARAGQPIITGRSCQSRRELVADGAGPGRRIADQEPDLARPGCDDQLAVVPAPVKAANLLLPGRFYLAKRHRDVRADDAGEDEVRRCQRQPAVAAYRRVITSEALKIRPLGPAQQLLPGWILLRLLVPVTSAPGQ